MCIPVIFQPWIYFVAPAVVTDFNFDINDVLNYTEKEILISEIREYTSTLPPKAASQIIRDRAADLEKIRGLRKKEIVY